MTVPGRLSPAVLLRHRRCHVVLRNQTQYVNHQLGGAPKYPRTGDSHATGRDNSSDVRSRRGGSTAAQLDSAGHRESPLMELEEEGRRSPHNRVDRCVPESFFDRVTQGLRGDLEHERNRRLQMADTVSKHRAEFALAQLENERALTSLRDELRVARGIADRSRDEIAAL
uniref:Uncharacterized protein n=1 Tax=Peronospora matthiolae TaxID=2874970 RepID=A0AAV1U5K5_9STRA